MKNKGFTIIEIIVALAIIVSLGLVVGVGINKVYQNSAEDDIKSFQDKVEASTDLYMANNDSLKSLLYTTRGFVKVKIGDLMNSGLLQRGTIDPETGLEVDEENEVTVSLGPEGLLKIEYNKNELAGPYLEAQTLTIKKGESFNCSSISSYSQEWGSYTLRLVSNTGYTLNNYIDTIILSISCNINTSSPGTYKIDYTYTTPGLSGSRIYTRNAVVTEN